MDAQLIVRLEQTLRKHLELLDDYLCRPNAVESNRYLPIAGQLRVLLCDERLPILLTYAEAKAIPLSVWGPRRVPEGLTKGLVLSMSPVVAEWFPQSVGQWYKIREFLDVPVGYESVSINKSDREAKPYTPRQLIKWVANKEGVCHLEFDQPSTFEKLKGWKWHAGGNEYESGLVRKQIVSLGVWARQAIREVLVPPSDLTVILRLTLRKKPGREAALWKIASPQTGVELVCSGHSDHLSFTLRHGFRKLTDLTANYPEEWCEGRDCLFALAYDSSKQAGSAVVNGVTIQRRQLPRLDSLVHDGSGVPLPGRGEYFGGEMALFKAIPSTAEWNRLIASPLDWFSEIRRRPQTRAEAG